MAAIEMELKLSETEAQTFNLEKAVCSHGLFMMAPNIWDPLSKTLLRPLLLDSREAGYGDGDGISDPKSSSAFVRISHSPSSPDRLNLSISGVESLSPKQQQFLQDQVKRMLRLSETDEQNVRNFQNLHEESKVNGFGRVFRSPTLFEDMVKCILLCNCQWSRTLTMAHSLCELQYELHHSTEKLRIEIDHHFAPDTPGAKELNRKHGRTSIKNKFTEHEGEMDLMDSITLGNFPSPRELAAIDEGYLAKRCKLGYRASRISKLAKTIVNGSVRLDQLEEACVEPSLESYVELIEQLKGINGFGPFTCANTLMCMGFYHVIPTDSETIRHLKQVHGRNSTLRTVAKDVNEMYNKYAPFQFLAY
ncbi:uncharacterized protein LOC124936111 isoform X2 [Impatiens glandulifera]|nr:uncharacterized protein LOC124936111 isoform X2 [Impatiens glandulifera]